MCSTNNYTTKEPFAEMTACLSQRNRFTERQYLNQQKRHTFCSPFLMFHLIQK